MYIKFLKDLRVGVLREETCGDGCCSWMEHDGYDDFKVGDEVWEYNIEMWGLEEGIDFEYIED